MPTSSTVKTKDGIEWYVEQQGSGPHLVLIPSGEGDCESFAKTAGILSKDFTVTTFDMPGMSRSVAPAATITKVTSQMLAAQIRGLLDELKIKIATIYGCSSGARASIFLMIDHPEKVQSIIIYEAPLSTPPPIRALQNMKDDAEVIKACEQMSFEHLCADPKAWEDLGPDFHARLSKNYLTGIRGYDLFGGLPWNNEQLQKRPVTWTIGAKTPAAMFYDNVVATTKAGIEIGLLDSKHFPQVSIPGALAEHIKTAALKSL